MDEPGTSGVKEAKKKPKVEKKTAEATESKHKKTMMVEVCEAVGALEIPRKGASAQAVRKYILSKHEESEHSRVKTRINQALGKAVEQGMLTRPASSKDTTGATGCFLLAKKTNKEKLKTSDAKIEKPEKAESDKQPSSKPMKGSKKLFSEEKIEKKTSKPKQANTKPKSTTEKNSAPKNPKKMKVTETTKDEQMSDSDVLPPKKAKQLKSYSSDSQLTVAAEKKTGKSKVLKNAAKSAKTDLPEKSKLPKATKTTKNAKSSKKNPSLNETYSNDERKDLSDSEIMVKKATRKSIKSYSSDSELPDSSGKSAPVKETAKKRQNTKH